MFLFSTQREPLHFSSKPQWETWCTCSLWPCQIVAHGTQQYCTKDRNIWQWNRFNNSEINLCIYGQNIFDKSFKPVIVENRLQQQMVGRLDTLMENKLELYLQCMESLTQSVSNSLTKNHKHKTVTEKNLQAKKTSCYWIWS
jgi:hypothetical protein